MTTYATVDDITTLWRTLTLEEEKRAAKLLDVVSATLREKARRVGKDLNDMINTYPDLAEVARSVTVDVVARMLMASTDREAMSQYSESAGGYTVSGTFLSPGGGLYIKKSELARLGLLRQRYGGLDLYGVNDQGDLNPTV